MYLWFWTWLSRGKAVGTIGREVRQVEWRFKSSQEIYPSSMQAEIMALLHREGAPDSDFGAAELICVELIGNLIRHARGAVTVNLDWSGEFPKLSVLDDAKRFVPPAIGLPADPLAESGRGLFIIKALARELSLPQAGGASGPSCVTLPVRRAT